MKDSKIKSDSRRKLWAQRALQNLCIYCGLDEPQENKKGCEKCLHKKSLKTIEFCKTHKEKTQQYRLLIKFEVLEKYGGECACCGEKELLFLTIDHINNDGCKERKKEPFSSTQWYLKLRKEPIRSNLQVLCFNCNFGKNINGGVCPHKEIRKKLNEKFDNRHNPQFDTRLKIFWPTDEELIKMCNTTSVAEVARQLKVNFSAVSGRLKRRGKYDLVIKKSGGILKGEKNKSAKLTKEIVEQIRIEAKSISRKELAIRYKVSKSTIDKIITKENWK